MKVLTVPQSGSKDGVTASRNRYGQYLRTRAIPVNPNTSFQVDARNRLAALSTEWRSLTGAQRTAWIEAATEVTRVDSLGQTQTMTGFSYFQSVNNISRAQSPIAAIITNPPALATFDAFTVVLDPTTGGETLTFDSDTAGDSDIIEVQAVCNLSPGVSFYKGFKTIGYYPFGPDEAALNANLTARFGDRITGMQIVTRCREIKNNQRGPFIQNAMITIS